MGRAAHPSRPSGAVKSGPIDNPGHVFSRVHVEDIAGACLHLIDRAASGLRPTLVNVCDDLPAEPAQVQQHAAELLASYRKAGPMQTLWTA